MAMNIDLARHNMIEQQIRTWEVLDPTVLDVLATVRREDYVPVAHRRLAFADTMIPLNDDEVMMKPVVEGRMLQALAVRAHERVLEIGTGSGYITACLSRMGRAVTSVEIDAELSAAAGARLSASGIDNVELIVEDACSAQWQPDSQVDVVVLTGGVYQLPELMRNWVKPGGRLFAISGAHPIMDATIHQRVSQEQWRSTVAFETDLPYLRGAEQPQRFDF